MEGEKPLLRTGAAEGAVCAVCAPAGGARTPHRARALSSVPRAPDTASAASALLPDLQPITGGSRLKAHIRGSRAPRGFDQLYRSLLNKNWALQERGLPRAVPFLPRTAPILRSKAWSAVPCVAMRLRSCKVNPSSLRGPRRRFAPLREHQTCRPKAAF
ncbi:hypothetical protein NDU88_006088 [Pleurodeles waltl]|uniref:Uncharacterized protein n=1 Tax=Pleurodeles waltl TaxID=8319 RepID=A0AAV7SNS7_PLEWA|nr:hypothetical protein NDU88_006088 [Pleurodeles waltl]